MMGLAQQPDTTAAGKDGTRRRRGRWLPVAILFAAVVLTVSPELPHLWWHWTHRDMRVRRARADVQHIASGVETFKEMRGRYPTTEAGLKLLIDEKFLKPNAEGGKLQDPWGRDYVYVQPGQAHPDTFDVRSYGADGQPGGEGEDGDLSNE
jgi:type II secretion system protein G